MIQFNLLPDVKLAYLKTERQKHLTITAAIIASIVALSIFVFLVIVVRVFQQTHMNDVTADVEQVTEQINKTENINRMLTIQSQLDSLNTLHDGKPVTTRLYDYITQLTPAGASISEVKLDYATNTLEISGKVPTLAIVQKYADTLKYTTYRPAEKEADDESPDPAVFVDVVLSSFGREKEFAKYTLTMSFDPIVFSGTTDTTVTVPIISSSDTTKEQPTPTFEPVPTTEGVQ